MAKRRLNKKIAFIGSLVLVVFLGAAVVVILTLSRDPQKFIDKGDAALAAKDYKAAEQSYLSALGKARTDKRREEILQKLVDLSIESGELDSVVRYWGGIITINPQNAKARFGRLRYLYIVAETGSQRLWQQVHKDAVEFLKVAEEAGLLNENVSQWDVLIRKGEKPLTHSLGACLHLVKGRAMLEMTMLGAVTNKDESLAEAVADLEEVKKLEPENIEIYRHLANAAVEKGRVLSSRGGFQERDKVALEAKALLEEAVRVAPDDPMAHINLLMLELAFAQRDEQAREEIIALEGEYLSLAEKFPTSPQVYVMISKFYSTLSSYTLSEVGQAYLDKAIEAAEKAVEMDKENVAYAINAMNLHYGKSSIHRQTPDLYRAIELARNALTLRDARDRSGPWSFANKINRLRLYSFLAHIYVEEVLEPSEVRTESQTQEWLASADSAVREIEQIFGSGQEPQVVKWRGLLELAKGDRKSAVKKLYAAYEQTKSLKPANQAQWPQDQQFAYLCYLLARVFKQTSEVGAVAEFLTSALYSQITDIVPEARLDYVEVIMKFRLWPAAIEHIDAFEKRLAPNDRSQLLRIATYIGAGDVDKAAKAMATRPQDDPNSVKLSLSLVQARIKQTEMGLAGQENRELLDVAFAGALIAGPNESPGSVEAMKKELNDYRQLEVQLVNLLLPMEPNSVGSDTIVGICRHYIKQDNMAKARDVVNRFLGYFPEDIGALVYKQVLAEPSPAKVAEERRNQIEEEVLSSIKDPVQRSLELGIFYRRHREFDKAADILKKVLDMEASHKKIPQTWFFSEAEENNPRFLAVGHLFDIALETQNWELAQQAETIAQREDLDGCEGKVFAARLAFARQDFKEARTQIDECIKQRPVFSRAYSLRSSINTALGNDHAALEDVRRATSMNPLDGLIAKGFAQLLYIRNKKVGDNVTPEDVSEARNALQRAMALNPYDVQLRSFYADFVAMKEPLKALAILQAIQKSLPTFENSMRLGELATRVAREESDPRRREVLFAVAGTALAEAKKMHPEDRGMLYLYTEYLRAMGRDKEVEAILTSSNENGLLWNHYYQRGQYEEAKDVLLKLYEKEPNNVGVLKGLLLIAEKMTDPNAAAKYSEDLIAADPVVESYLIQIQSFLRVGLIKEAGLKLQSFTEKYPDEPRTMLLRAWLLMRKGQFEEALELTNRYLEGNSDNAAGWRLRGEIRFYEGDMPKAINDLKQSKSLSDEAITRVVLAKAYLRVAQYEDAMTELKNAIDMPGAPLDARLLLEDTYMRLDRKDALKEFYNDVLSESRNNIFWLNRAASFALENGEYNGAVQLYGKSFQMKRQEYSGKDAKNLRFDALYASAFDGYLRSLIMQAGVPNTSGWNPKKLDEVFELAKDYIETDYAPLAYLRMAQAKLLLGHKKTATDYCQKAVDEAEANETLASEVLLRMFLLLGPDEVSKYCTEKLKSNPDSLPANFTMFNLAKVNSEYNKAVAYIDKCIQLTEADNPRRTDYMAKKAEILTLAYQRSSDNKYLEMAIADYESLLAKMPNNTSVLNNLAYMLALSNERLPDALKYSETVYSLMPNDPGVLDTYGYVLHKNGKHLEAAERLAAAVQQYEQNKVDAPPEVYEHLGMVKEALGDKVAAIAEYQRVLEIGASRLTDKDKERINKAIERVSR